MLLLFLILISYLSSILMTAQHYNFISILYTLLPKMPHQIRRNTNIHTHTHTHAHTNILIRAHKCMLINANSCTHAYTCTNRHTFIHMCIITHTQRHAGTLFLLLSLLGFHQFYKKKKLIYHCMLFSKCNNYNSKQHMLIHVKFDCSKRSITVNK